MKYLILLLFSNLALASELTLLGGLGINGDNAPFLGLKYEMDGYKVEFGQLKESKFITYGWGTKLDFEPLFISFFIGPTILLNPDNVRLSGNTQFNSELCLTLKDKNGKILSLSYKHISNAGLSKPNFGRDFVLLGVGLEL